MSKKFEIKDGDISDGNHTFDELYEHRYLLYLNLCLMHPRGCTWKQDLGEYFCLYMETRFGQISYHIPNKYRVLVEGKIHRDDNYIWDRHTSEDVIHRLGATAKFQASAIFRPIHLVD